GGSSPARSRYFLPGSRLLPDRSTYGGGYGRRRFYHSRQEALMHIRNVPVLVLTFLLCSFGTVSAQPAEDYRLSSSVLGFRLPEDLQIQSAADIGDARLAVWATTFPTGAGESEGGLVMNLNGMESRLTKSGARPYGAVDVVAFADRFLVLWNDRR